MCGEEKDKDEHEDGMRFVQGQKVHQGDFLRAIRQTVRPRLRSDDQKVVRRQRSAQMKKRAKCMPIPLRGPSLVRKASRSGCQY